MLMNTKTYRDYNKICENETAEEVIIVRPWWKESLNQKGSVTVTFLVSMVVFLFLFVFVLNISKVWYSHSHSQVAADGASLAASLKANEIVSREINSDVQALENYIDTEAQKRVVPLVFDYETARREVVSESIQRGDIQDRVYDKQYNEIELVYLLQEVYINNGLNIGDHDLNNDELGNKLRDILSGNQTEIISYVSNYVIENGSVVQKDVWRGRINFNYKDGRVHVIPGTELKPVELSNMKFSEFAPVEGDGAGPDLGYPRWMKDDLIFNFGP